MIKIKENPPDDVVMRDVDSAQIVSVIHGCSNEAEIIDFAENYAENNGLKVVYIHHYLNGEYTMGLNINE
jgi:hypothetical protein